MKYLFKITSWVRKVRRKFQLEGVGKIGITDAVKCITSIINDPLVRHSDIIDDQKIGRHLMELKKAFGWGFLFFDVIPYRALRDTSVNSFTRLIDYVTRDDTIFQRMKDPIDDSIPPEKSEGISY